MEGLPVQLQPSNLRPIAYRILSKKHGLNIKTDGLKKLTEIISHKFGSDWKGSKCQIYLEDIAKNWKNQDKGLFIDSEGLKEVVKQLDNEKKKEVVVNISNEEESNEMMIDNDFESNKENEEINWRDYFKVLNPNDLPNYKFDKVRKQFIIQPQPKLSNFLDSSNNYFQNRYNIIKDRLSRNDLFKKRNYQSISTIMEKQVNNEITIIKNVIGRDKQKFILFGLISKNHHGKIILEDSSDSIELNLTQANRVDDCYLNFGMFVIVEGIYSQFNEDSPNGLFYVSSISQPPSERRDNSLEVYGNIDFNNLNKENLDNLNHISKLNKDFKKKLSKLEKNLNNKIIVVGSNLFLDDLKIMANLKRFLNKIENDLVNDDDEFTPIAIVFVGSFISKPISPVNSSISSISDSELYKNNFNNFSTLLSNYTNIITRCKIVLIPGSNDPWQSSYSLGNSNLNYLPQKPIPEIFLNRLQRLLKDNLVIGWNPIKINYLSQDILIFKDELVRKFRRNELILDTEKVEGEVVSNDKTQNLSPSVKQSRKLVKTLLDQGSLQPFSKDLKLINPIYDNILRLEPLPNILILNDTNFSNFEINYNHCKVVNITGLSDKFGYLEYFPSTKKTKFNEV